MDSVRFGYARVSKRESDADWSLENQVSRLLDYGIRPEHIYQDVISGSRSSRPGWDAMMRLVQSGDVIVVRNLDRFSRSALEGLMTISELREDGIGIVALNEGVDSRDDSPMGNIQVQLLLMVSEWFRNTTRQRILEGQDYARQSGRKLGRPKALSRAEVRDVKVEFSKGVSKSELARLKGVSRPTIDNALEEILD